MTLAELDEHIKTFKRRAIDPNLSEAQRAAFQAALEGAEKQRAELLAAQAPKSAPSVERTKPVKTKAPDALGQVSPPAVSLEQEPPVPFVKQPEPTDSKEKKTLVRPSVQTVGTFSTPNPDSEIVVDCDLSNISKTVIIFRWGNTEERLSPGVAMGRFKARVADVARLKHKRLEESRCFRRAVGYYEGLCRFAGRELDSTDFGFRGRRADLMQTIREALKK
ncbi:MAG: hypothetical protein KDD14_21235 [Saprospiraceae bacterium]|nr:hypothetical protein [Saprospiraceae bacterium]